VIVWGGALAPTVRTAPLQEPRPGGTLRLGVFRSFEFWADLDPTQEYSYLAWGIFSNLLLRTLVTYRHVEGPEGAELMPDLATEAPVPTDEGKTYTFELKEGVRFGPPLDRPITSHDVAYAFERIGSRRYGGGYSHYYLDVIQGLRAFYRKRADGISGIETPDDRTIVFHLTRPTGDFLHRLTLPATAAMPPEVARCKGRQYGNFLIASGPYMLDGSDELVVDQGCEAMEKIRRETAEDLHLVRNPSYDPATDNPEIRENLVDEVRFQEVDGMERLFGRVERGELESAVYPPIPRIRERYENDPSLAATLRSGPLDRTWYITMNLTQPPFDDIHVRKAANLVTNKAEVRDEWGGPITSEIATHILPPNLTGGHPSASEYDPYASRDHRGDGSAARDEMRLSRHDSDNDGFCDGRACKNVKVFIKSYGPWRRIGPIIEQRFRRWIGIDLELVEVVDVYTPIMNVSSDVPLAVGPGWQKDYADPNTFMPYLFSSDIPCFGNYNYSLVGATPKTARKCNARGNFEGLPNVDERIEECQGLLVGPERTQCWIDLDAHLMEEVVPWVPLMWERAVRLIGPTVTKYEFDQFSGELAFSHMAVDESRQTK
jgi:peptide/nickel transport system substrate-binding protein